jgi:hypothetical protein
MTHLVPQALIVEMASSLTADFTGSLLHFHKRTNSFVNLNQLQSTTQHSTAAELLEADENTIYLSITRCFTLYGFC